MRPAFRPGVIAEVLAKLLIDFYVEVSDDSDSAESRIRVRLSHLLSISVERVWRRSSDRASERRSFN